jgi:hypothetical protein
MPTGHLRPLLHSPGDAYSASTISIRSRFPTTRAARVMVSSCIAAFLRVEQPVELGVAGAETR